MCVTGASYHRHGMETRQRVSGVEQQRAPRHAGADAFLAALRKEQARFIEAIGQAAAFLGPESGQLSHACATQAQLTRQFLDAQRSILQLRAETDQELALIGAVPGHPAPAPDGELDASHRQQLSLVLDQWWAGEGLLRRTIIDEARDAVQQYLARLAASDADAALMLPTTAARVLAELEVADATDLHSLLDELIYSLVAAPLVGPQPSPVTASPGDLRFIDAGTDNDFGEFWAAREVVEPVDESPRRRLLLPSAVWPVAAVASLLTLAMAWMG